MRTAFRATSLNAKAGITGDCLCGLRHAHASVRGLGFIREALIES